ncbi:hypothetical protein [Nocardioides sambongensis]|uniref:hypothetical protein n=1 Tax=Nocardioides sambongensis TaxID=2589074 RepID=UPI00112D6F79|nr:hypothetical protein [Nocardioides sambongensis]
MPHARRLVSATAALVAAASLTGCGLGDSAPRPGLAAEVEGTTLSLVDLEALLDAACINASATEDAGASSRDTTQLSLLQQWIGSSVLLSYADDEGLETVAPALDESQIAGWEEMDEHQQEVLADYLARQQRAERALQAAGDDVPDPAGFDVEINPTFELTISEGSFALADEQLSVAVSDEAVAAGEQTQLTDEQLAALPDSQLCGTRPDPSTAAGLGG